MFANTSHTLQPNLRRCHTQRSSEGAQMMEQQ